MNLFVCFLRFFIIGIAILFIYLPAKAITAPDPGTLDGSFDVGPQGTAAYTIPIKCPPGTAGMVPKLALSYNSQAGPGVMGPGWSVSGYSIITRGPMNLERDGVVAGAKFDASDALYLDGSRLIPVNNTPSGPYIEYRSEIDDFSRVRGYGQGDKGHDSFLVWTKAGLLLSFGKTDDSRPSRRDGAPFLWMCNRIEDTLGNYIAFEYELHDGGDYNLKKVSYTGNDKAKVEPYASIEFEYQKLSELPTTAGKGLPITTAYVAGEKIFRNFRLASIRSQFGQQLLCRYELAYRANGGNGPEHPTDSPCGFRLDHITEVAADGRRYRPTRFTYTESLPVDSPAWAERPNFLPSDALPAITNPSAARVGVHYAKLNADATDDLIVSQMVDGKLHQETYFSLNGQWEKSEAYRLPVPLASEGQPTSGIVIRDINNDNRADVLVNQTNGISGALLSGPQDWQAKDDFVLPTPIGTKTENFRHFILLDLDGDRNLDILWRSQNPLINPSTGAFKQTATGWQEMGEGFLPPAALDAHGSFVLVIDANVDGKEDLIYCESNKSPRVWLATPTGLEEQAVDSPFALHFLSPSHPHGIQVGDVTGDKAMELLASYRAAGTDVSEAFSATATGWQPLPPAWKPPFQFLTPEGSSIGPKLSNIGWEGNQDDGKQDLLVHTKASGGQVHRFAFVSTAAGWVNKPDLYPPHPLALVLSSGAHIELPVFLPDAEGKARSTLVYQVPVSSDSSTHVPSKAAFISDGQKWVETADFRPPVMLAHQAKPDQGVRFVDFNADGLADLLLHYKPYEGEAVKRSFLNTSKGWSQAGAEKWHFPLPLSSEDGKAPQVTFVDVNGDARVDALVHHLNEKGAVTHKAAYLNTPDDPTNCWKETANQQWHPPVPLSHEQRGDMGVRFIDLNGDGLTDIISSVQKLDGSISNRVWLNDRSGWVEQNQNTGYTQLPAGLAFAHEFRPIEADKQFQDMAAWNLRTWRETIRNRDTGVWLGDLNGDRLPDICFSQEFLQTEEKTAEEIQKIIEDWKKLEQAQKPGDPPLPPLEPWVKENLGQGTVRVIIKHNPIVSGALLNTGSGWSPSPDYSPPKRLDTPWSSKTHYYEPQDLNLDGLSDIVFIDYRQDGNHSTSFLNTGRGWEKQAAPDWKLPDSLFHADAIAKEGKGDHGIRLMDINGDGAVDILQSYRIGNGNIPAKAFLNNGQTWVERSNYVPSVEGKLLPMADKSGDDTGVRPVDVNGDLIADLISWKKYEDGTEVRAAYVNQSKRRDILLTVENGMGFKIQFDHRTMTLWNDDKFNPHPTPDNPNSGETPSSDRLIGSFYTPAASPGTYPILPAPPPVHAVETVRLWEPDANGNLVRLKQSLRYRYGEFRVNSLSGMPLGFGWRTVINEQNGMTEFTRFNQTGSPYLVGTTVESRTAYNKDFIDATEAEPCPGTQQSRLTNEWGQPKLIECLPNPAGKPYIRAQIALKSAKSELFDLDGTRLGHQMDSFEYDGFGNTTKVRTVRYNADGSEEGTGSETVSQFDNDEKKWYLGRLSRATATLWSGKEKQVRTSTFGYDPTSGLLNRETSFDGHPKSVTITYEHDIFGNKVATKTTAAGLQARTATVRFDPLGRFPIETTNALGHKSTAEYEPVFGNVLAATDPNGVTARSTYDSHGAVATQTSPTGVVATSSYRFLDQPVIVGEKTPSRAVFETVAQVGNLPESRTLVDAQGRTLRTIAVGEGGKRIFQDTEYDDLKRPYRASIPYFEGTKPADIHWSITTYEDGTDRPLSVTSPDGGTVRYAYKGLTTTVTDKLGRKTFTEYNLRKLPLRITDPIKGVLRYAYDVGDRLTRVTNADGTVTRHVYDDLGQRTETFDPDLGHWQYRYNAYNELIWQKDAKGQVTQLTYDVLGRPETKQEADRGTRWVYDRAKHGVGKLNSILSSDGYSETYTFDHLGRTTQVSVTAMGETFTTSSSFDEYNRTVGLTYPTGFQIRHDFDKLGFMRTVWNAKSNQIYWKGLRYNEFGQVAEEKFGNGIQTTHAYNRKTGYLDSIAAKDSQGQAVQDLRYTYDLAGNVKARTDGVQQLDERFTYDSLDRLTSASVNGRITQSLRYGITGTILSKSDMGTYTYGDGGKKGPAHGVSTITKPDGRVDHYRYDANGNLIASPTLKHATYTASNLTASLHSDKGVWSEFKYSPTGQKYWQEMRNGLAWVRTLYLGLYERIQEEMVPPWMPTNERLRHRHYIAAPSGTCAIVEDITEFYPVRHSSRLHTLSPRGGDKNERTTRQVASTVYLHSDALGSLSAISDTAGKVIERLRFDPWGKRIPSAEEIEKGKERYYTYKNGFTGHDHLDNLGLVHMGGRVFDPAVALFTRADPVTQTLTLSAGFNRFAYVLNNPLKFTDPSGYSWLSKAWGAVTKPFKKAWSWMNDRVFVPIGKWFAKNWKPVVIIVAAVAVSVLTYGTMTGWAAATASQMLAASIVAGAAAGAVSGGLTAAFSKTNILEGMIQGAAMGAMTGMFAGMAGAAGSGLSGSWAWAGRAGLQASAGGLSSLVQEGNFWAGALSGASGSLIASNIQTNGFDHMMATKVCASAVAGGFAAEIGGGKFENGAIFATFATLTAEVTSVLASTDEVRLTEPSSKPKQSSREVPRLIKRAASQSQLLRDQLLSDNHLTLDEANIWFREGGGETLWVDATRLTVEVYSSRMQTLMIGPDLVTEPVYGLLAGRTIVSGADYLVHGQVTIAPNGGIFCGAYDFEMHAGLASAPRNFATLLGRYQACGNFSGNCGIPFDICYRGKPKIINFE